jgi:hypothetical protein
MGEEAQVSFLIAGYSGKLDMLSRRLSAERKRAMREEVCLRKKAAFPAGFVSRTTWDIYFEDVEPAEKKEWKPPVQKWLESREERRQNAWERPPWLEEEAGGGEEAAAGKIGSKGTPSPRRDSL